jgi:hypothetical protein
MQESLKDKEVFLGAETIRNLLKKINYLLVWGYF